MTPIRLLALLLVTGCGLVPHTARAAESYDSCTGFIDSVPTTVSSQGVWCLRNHLSTAITSGNAITIAGNNITIDCNGFRLGGLAAGAGSQTRGIRAENRQNVTVRGCNVRGFLIGIVINGGAGHIVEDNRLDNNLNIGILMPGATNSLIRGNLVFDTGGTSSAGYDRIYGIRADADIIGNTVSGIVSTTLFVTGIRASSTGLVIRDNTVRGLATGANGAGRIIGIDAITTGARIERNHVHLTGLATDSRGIYGNTGTACIDNTVINFTAAYTFCSHQRDNVAIPAPL